MEDLNSEMTVLLPCVQEAYSRHVPRNTETNCCPYAVVLFIRYDRGIPVELSH